MCDAHLKVFSNYMVSTLIAKRKGGKEKRTLSMLLEIVLKKIPTNQTV